MTNYNGTIFTWTKDRIKEVNKKYPPPSLCSKCEGDGWLWWHELNLTLLNQTEINDLSSAPLQKHTCDRCHGRDHWNIILKS